MIKEALSEAGLAPIAVVGLIAFVAVFTSVIVWTLTRSRRQVDTWSSLPLADGTDPVEPRDTSARKRGSGTPPRTTPGTTEPHEFAIVRESCGKCAECTCVTQPLTPVAWSGR